MGAIQSALQIPVFEPTSSALNPREILAKMVK